MAKAAGAKPAESTGKASSLTDEERAQISALSYEQARDQLTEAVQALEAGGLDLEIRYASGSWAKPWPGAPRKYWMMSVPNLMPRRLIRQAQGKMPALRGIWSKRPEKLRAKKFKTPV